MPATCACVRQPRSAERAATKSNVSWISLPDRYITVIVFSNGNTLNICSFVSGPGSKSARMPSEFVNANSASTPCWSCIDARDQVAELRVAAGRVVARDLRALPGWFTEYANTPLT